jgi:hypothetical protein
LYCFCSSDFGFTSFETRVPPRNLWFIPILFFMFDKAQFYPVQHGEGISPTELEALAVSMRSDRIPEVQFAFIEGIKIFKIRFAQTEMFAFKLEIARQLAFLIIVGSI